MSRTIVKNNEGQMKKKDSLKSLIVLVAICLVIALAMAAINMITSPRIAEAEAQAEQDALLRVLSYADGFVAVEGDYPETVSAVYRASNGCGYAVMLSAKGYDSSKPMSIAVGFDADGRLIGCHAVSVSGETTGIGTKVTGDAFLGQFIGQNQSLEGVDAISGATISSSAFIEAVRDAFVAVETAKEVGA